MASMSLTAVLLLASCAVLASAARQSSVQRMQACESRFIVEMHHSTGHAGLECAAYGALSTCLQTAFAGGKIYRTGVGQIVVAQSIHVIIYCCSGHKLSRSHPVCQRHHCTRRQPTNNLRVEHTYVVVMCSIIIVVVLCVGW
jgi:hypothetical protein